MNFFKSWTFGKHALTCLVLSIVIYKIYSFVFPKRQAASIGIIGGADGPTAIFLTGKLLGAPSIIFIVALLILLALYTPIKNWLSP